LSKITGKILAIAAAVGATLAAAGVLIVALAYAEFAFARQYLTKAGSAAVVAGTIALIFVIGALVMVAKSNWKPRKPEPTLGEQAAEFIKTKPIAAAALALGGGFLALRNPALVTSVVLGFLAPRDNKKR
jgi:hypothetical protein